MEIFDLTLRQLPLFNKVAILSINFIVLILLITVFNHKKFKDKVSKLFLWMSLSMFFWVNFAYLARITGYNLTISEIFLRIAWFATPPLFYFTYLISLTVLNKDSEYKKTKSFLFVCTVALSVLTAFTKLIIEGVVLGEYVDIVYGVAFYPFLATISVYMVATIFPFIRSKKTKSALVFVSGVLIFYFANLVFNIALPVFMGITHLYFFGDYSTLILLSFTFYSILKHELFDVKIIATELLTSMLWVVLLVRLFIFESLAETVIDVIILTFAFVFGILLIRSMMREINQKEKLEELNVRLKELDKQKNEFISMAAHELRSPLTAIKGYLSMVLDGDAGDITDKARGYLNDSSAVNDRLIRLVNNMLNVSRIEEGRLVYQMEEVDLIKSVQEVYYSFKFEADRKQLDFKLDIKGGTKDKVIVDPDRIKEVTGNLVSNAIKFTEKGFVDIKIYNVGKKGIRVEVVDSGPGISKEEQVKLFHKFYRASSTEGKTIGTGLGLYISKLLVEKFGGKIGLESEYGKGSKFWFELPMSKKS